MALKKPKLVMILAGGLGTRLRSVVSNVPKPMALVRGSPFLEHILRYWKNEGINNFILCVGYKSELIVEHFGDNFQGSKIFYSIEKVPLGTGGSVIQAVKNFNLKDPFILINGDTFFEVDLEDLHKFSVKKKADWSFSLFDSGDKTRYLSIGIKLNGSIDFLRTITKDSDNLLMKKKKESLINHICGNGGVYWINPKVFDSFLNEPTLSISLENDIFHRGMKLGQNFYGLRFTGTFIDIGLPADYNRAQLMDCFKIN